MAEEEGRQLLDSKIVEYFDTMDALFNCQQELQDQISAGFFNLSKARYSMGVKAVGALQFDGRVTTASATVDVASESDQRDSGQDLFTLIRDGCEKAEEKASVEAMKLRQRQKKSTNKEEEKEDWDDMNWINDQIQKMGIGSLDGLPPKDPKPKPSAQDPLKWFGVLVPQALRASQTSFQNAIQLAVEIANLRNKLLSIKTDYQELVNDKGVTSS